MNRDLDRFTQHEFDLLVIGGGIYGACIARDAASRGLSVALVEKGDFGSGASANCLKIIHGGLRYLQDGNLPLVRKMMRERRAWLRTAPHLVRPLPVVMPTYANAWPHNRPLLTLAARLNDLLSFDRNRDVDPERALPPARALSRGEVLRALPGLNPAGITGGVLWYDAQIDSPERLVLDVVRSACEHGALAANYVRAIRFLRQGQTICGVQAQDELGGRLLQIHARLVVNAAGAWVDEVLDHLNPAGHTPHFQPSGAMNLITRRIDTNYAAGLRSQPADGKPRVLFIAPWHGLTLAGTIHAPAGDANNGWDPGNGWVSEADIQNFLAELNQAYPGANLSRDDVYGVHQGYLPAVETSHDGRVRLVRESQVVDHEPREGLAGLLTVVGVKFTTARHTAEQTVDLALRKLDRTDKTPSRTTHLALHSAPAGTPFDQYTSLQVQRWQNRFDSAWLTRLHNLYSADFPVLVAEAQADRRWSEPLSAQTTITQGEVRHAVRREMARRLGDVVWRRTSLAAAGRPDESAVLTCARLMADELGWDGQRTRQEIDSVFNAPAAQIRPRPAGSGLAWPAPLPHRRPVAEVTLQGQEG